MAKLIMSLDNAVIREVPLDKGRFTIGRKPHNDIQIDNLAVSGEHALIVTILNDSFLEDLGSTNGTLVNGNPVKKHILQTNDVVEIGKYKLKYVNDANAGQATVQDFEKTMVLRAPMAKSMGASPAGSFGDTQINATATSTQSRPQPTAAPSAAKPPESLAAIQILTGNRILLEELLIAFEDQAGIAQQGFVLLQLALGFHHLGLIRARIHNRQHITF